MTTLKFGLAAVLALGVASHALAGEGSPDLSYPPGYEYAPSHASDAAYRHPVWAARGAYAQVGAGEDVRRNEQLLFDRATGNGDGV